MLIVVARLDVVQGLLLAIKLVECRPEKDTANEGKYTHDAIVPYEQSTGRYEQVNTGERQRNDVRVGGQRYKGLAEGVRDAGAEQEH